MQKYTGSKKEVKLTPLGGKPAAIALEAIHDSDVKSGAKPLDLELIAVLIKKVKSPIESVRHTAWQRLISVAVEQHAWEVDQVWNLIKESLGEEARADALPYAVELIRILLFKGTSIAEKEETKKSVRKRAGKIIRPKCLECPRVRRRATFRLAESPRRGHGLPNDARGTISNSLETLERESQESTEFW